MVGTHEGGWWRVVEGGGAWWAHMTEGGGGRHDTAVVNKPRWGVIEYSIDHK